MSNFIEACISGDAFDTDIDDYVEAWHKGKSEKPLPEFLGMTEKEYALYLKSDDVIPFIVRAHKERRGIEEIMNEEYHSLAARSENVEKASRIITWLKQEGLWH